MIRVCVVCEGQTEVEFVKHCVAPYLLNDAVLAYPTILKATSGKHRGGNVSVERVARFISHQCHEADRITTLVDFYGFGDRNGRSKQQLEADILEKVKAYTNRFDPRFVLPYVQRHEFEGLLFSDTEQFREVLDGWTEDRGRALMAVKEAFSTPGEIMGRWLQTRLASGQTS